MSFVSCQSDIAALPAAPGVILHDDNCWLPSENGEASQPAEMLTSIKISSVDLIDQGEACSPDLNASTDKGCSTMPVKGVSSDSCGKRGFEAANAESGQCMLEVDALKSDIHAERHDMLVSHNLLGQQYSAENHDTSPCSWAVSSCDLVVQDKQNH